MALDLCLNRWYFHLLVFLSNLKIKMLKFNFLVIHFLCNTFCYSPGADVAPVVSSFADDDLVFSAVALCGTVVSSLSVELELTVLDDDDTGFVVWVVVGVVVSANGFIHLDEGSLGLHTIMGSSVTTSTKKIK